jgi:hypothetical protein
MSKLAALIVGCGWPQVAWQRMLPEALSELGSCRLEMNHNWLP